MAMTLLPNRLLIVTLLFLAGLFSGIAHAAGDAIKEGGIGGTGSPTMHGGIGGTGSPTLNGGIGGTGLRPNDESAEFALAGKVLFVNGQVEAQNQSQIRLLTKGASVRVGDTLKSAKGATLQLRMADGGTIVLRPESQLAIESFVYKGVQDGSEHMSLALLSGGFRAVTGEIGHLHKENYSIRTPNAKIGILGTDHETVFVSATQGAQAAGVFPGTYNHVISGATKLQSESGNVLIKPNQTGFAALSGASPIMIATPLRIFGNQKINSGDELHVFSATRSTSGADQNSRGLNNSSLTNTTLDINTPGTNATPPPIVGTVEGVNMSNGLRVNGGSQTGLPGPAPRGK